MESQAGPLVDAEESAWILCCQQGDRQAFEPIVQKHRQRAASFALAWTGNMEDALDLSQEAFARAYRAISRFDPSRPFYPWLHRILRNLCLNHLGRAYRLHEVPPLSTAWIGRMPLRAPMPRSNARRSAVRSGMVSAGLGRMTAKSLFCANSRDSPTRRSRRSWRSRAGL